MEKVAPAIQRVLDVMDEEIETLEEKLRKAQPLIDRLAKLRQARARLLDEKSPTAGGGRRNAQLTMETVVAFLRQHGASTPVEIADHAGVDANIARSHLNRHADVRYRKNGDGKWHLIGENTDGEGFDEEEE